MTFVDTGFFLALVQRADALHLRATAWTQFQFTDKSVTSGMSTMR